MKARPFDLWPLLVSVLLLGSCSQRTRPPATILPAAEAPPPVNALAAGVRRANAVPRLDPVQAERAFRAFRISCPSLLARVDTSGLTRPADWARPCAKRFAPGTPPKAIASWFKEAFEPVIVGDGKAFVTGYYEPQIRGSRVKLPGYEVPVYRKPPDLVEISAEAAAAAGTLRRGRLEKGIIIPYADRAAIEDGALAGQGLEIAWAADPIELFFLQIQGSGRLLLPDGTVMRIGYAGQNGRDYVGIGKLMKDRGLLGPGQTGMQGIIAWLRAHPDEGRSIMRENLSYIFFRELTGPGPLGALNLPVTPRASVAADPKFAPLGAPVVLVLDRREANGLWVAQDTGGAIRGANRFDTFWGAGEEAALIAGGMTGRGTAVLLLPKGVLKRLRASASR